MGSGTASRSSSRKCVRSTAACLPSSSWVMSVTTPMPPLTWPASSGREVKVSLSQRPPCLTTDVSTAPVLNEGSRG